MSLMMVNPYRFVQAGAGVRTVLRLTSDISNPNTNYTIVWPTPAADDLGAYSNGTPTRLTAPTNGYYLLYACVAASGYTTASSGMGLSIRKNGSSAYAGAALSYRAAQMTSTALGYAGRTARTMIIDCTAGDYFDVLWATAEGSVADILGTAGMPTLFAMTRISTLHGALAYLTSDDTGINGTQSLPFDAEAYDTDSIWTSGAPTDFIVASGYDRASCTVQCYSGASDSNSSNMGAQVLLGGTVVASAVGVQGRSNPASEFTVHSGPLSVSSGNTIVARWLSADTSYTRTSPQTAAAIELHNDDCATAGLTSNITAIDAETSPPYFITWTSEIDDDAGFFTTGTGDRMTVDATGWFELGATVRFSGFGVADGALVTLYRYNSGGSLQEQYTETIQTTDATPDVSPQTPPVFCTAGDYWRVGIEANGDTSINILTGSRFWIRRLTYS